ncbi:dihydromonapterin reductase [Pseudoalteromonas luteoviolacea CPMOR-2]|uniref:dihydromonapterin reductase n=1 Tax=Pseudoalteromonas luteoviolacea TaxID=43657 RepID=UPI0007B09757|nr:dihydromonapterin reductase [Pseudoalteromonas luteoviolacea]KZN57224.1 dihydromonapterin reductase [Pseudoalteromonas luteoviolacea CPMOR-2]
MKAPILITGGAQRIGLAMAKYFIEQDVPVIITYRTKHDAVQALEAQGVKCIQIDFDQPDARDSLVTQVKAYTTQLRAVIHNASSWDCEKLNPDHDALFDNMMRIHAKVPYLLNLALAPLLEASNEVADIIHITDYVAEKGSPKHIAYAASKAALDNLSRSFAAKYAPQIKVNSIAPSLIIFNDDDDADYRAKTLKKSLMGIEPGCQEVISTIELLLNSSYITGRTLAVDGGRHLK